MIRRIIYCILLVAVLLAPVKRVDISLLRPAEIVAVYKYKESIVVETDWADTGAGESIQEAIRNLQEASASLVYLDSVKYLLIDKALEKDMDVICAYLKDSVKVCLIDGKVDINDMLQYMHTHKNVPNLGQYRLETGS